MFIQLNFFWNHIIQLIFFFCKFQDIGMDVEVTDKINTISCDSLTSVVTLLTNSFVTLHCNLIEFRKNSIVP